MKTIYILILFLLGGTAYGQTGQWVQTTPTGCKAFTWIDGKIEIDWKGGCKDGLLDGIGSTTIVKDGNLFATAEVSYYQGKINGKGVISWIDGKKYIGDFKDSKPHGNGQMTLFNENKYFGEFKGQFKDGKPDGQVTMSLASGDKYEGLWMDAMPNGRGIYIYSNGNKQEGEFKNGNLNGLGTTTFANGNKYVGNFNDGLANGQGTFTFANGDKYVGEFKDDNYNGQGTYTFANGDKYVGEYKDGKYNGQGTFTWANGDKYVGEYKDHKYNGQGTFTWANGNKYVGEWKDDKFNGQGSYTNAKGGKFVGKFKDGLAIGIGTETNPNGSIYVGEFKDNKRHGQGTLTFADGEKYVGEFKDGKLNGQGTRTYANGDKYVGEWKDEKYNGQGTFFWIDGKIALGEWKDDKPDGRFIRYFANKTVAQSGIFKEGALVTSQYIDPNSFTRMARTNMPSVMTDSQLRDSEQTKLQLEQERLRLVEERRRLDEDKRQREQAKQSSRISITASATQPDSNGVLTINIQTNSDTSSLKINGEELGGRVSGEYTVKKIARVGQDTKFTIAGIDVNGNTDTKTITVSRTVVESKVTYPELNPSRIKSQPERDAVAIIIGISNYKSLPKADYAKDDAQVFFDYAIRALGVRPGNIKLLMDEQADAEEIYTAFKTWLPARVKSSTDVYVFYSGHGLPTQDGSGLYWLPQRANRDLLAKTAILLQEINGDIQAAKPKSVTIFMDACYSGQARGGETLVASARPIALKSQPTTFPSNFTVISASQADQISSSSPELQHGIFSYYLMRGMEGEADLNKDGKITLDEIQAYLSENVGRQARIMNRQQEPQVIGDGSRVLVGR